MFDFTYFLNLYMKSKHMFCFFRKTCVFSNKCFKHTLWANTKNMCYIQNIWNSLLYEIKLGSSTEAWKWNTDWIATYVFLIVNEHKTYVFCGHMFITYVIVISHKHMFSKLVLKKKAVPDFERFFCHTFKSLAS